MIKDRWYVATGEELIYHYCPPSSFVEIVRSRTIWLSASYALNDISERSWGYSIFGKVTDRLRETVGAEFVDQITRPVAVGYLHGMQMIGCFSLDGDMLSQWRAYAQDGEGFAIGFSPKLIEMPAKQLRVLYDENDQIQELLDNFMHIYEVEKSFGFKYGEKFQGHLFHIGLDLCAYKNPAFREEREIRLTHVCGMVPAGKSIKIVALGAISQSGERLSDALETRFRVRKSVIIPYVVADYTNKGAVNPIKEVVLGPQNENDPVNVDIFLNTMGVSEVAVRKSTAPYRP
jgi:hypothetical protein